MPWDRGEARVAQEKEENHGKQEGGAMVTICQRDWQKEEEKGGKSFNACRRNEMLAC